MSDLISREALLQEIKSWQNNMQDERDIIDLITNAPAVSGEVFYQEYNPLISYWMDCDKDTYDKATERRILYTTPQQPQEQGELVKKAVADVLEELERALCLIGVVGNVDGHDVIRRDSVINVARQRIKRNAEEGE